MRTLDGRGGVGGGGGDEMLGVEEEAEEEGEVDEGERL